MARKFSTNSDGKPIYLTENGLQKLKDRLAKLKAALPGYIAETARTAAYGDRSENAEYAAAKGTLRRTHRLIFEIEDQLKRVKVIPETSGSLRVRIGSTVLLEGPFGSRQTFRILGSAETDPGRGRISFDSPLGKALMGKTAGETVEIETPSGVHKYILREIR